MKRNLSDYLVALAVIACSLILLGALTLALSDYRLKKPDRVLQIDYQDVTGIKVHSEVRYAGAPAGRVIGMRLLTPAERTASANKLDAVRLTISIDAGIPPIPSDSVASLGADTLLGQKFISLSAGNAAAPTLANNAVIEGHPAYGIEELTRAAGPLLDNANTLLANANNMVTNANGAVTTLKGDLADLMPKVSAVAVSAQGVSKSADVLLARATKLIADSEGGIKVDLAELESVTKALKELLKNADGAIARTDSQIQEQMKALHVVLLNLKVVSTYGKALTQDLSEKPNRLIFSGKANKLTPEAAILTSETPLPAKTQ